MAILHPRFALPSFSTGGCVQETSSSRVRTTSLTMTVLLKNLFTVHFQFDLLKLETNNTRDDKVKHAWIIAR